MRILTISNLHKSFGPLEVLKGIDLTLEKGDVVSLIGASGSGKTTLLRCVNLLETFEGGRIEIDVQPIRTSIDGRRTRLPARPIARQRATTVMAFQQFNLFPHMTARQNVMLDLVKTKRLARAEEAEVAERWLDRVRLLERAD